MIPTSIDGTDITGATIDGTDVTEITVDGQTVFTAVPDIPNLVSRYEFEQNALDSEGNNDLTDNTSVGYSPDSAYGSFAKEFDSLDEGLSTSFSNINPVSVSVFLKTSTDTSAHTVWMFDSGGTFSLRLTISGQSPATISFGSFDGTIRSISVDKNIDSQYQHVVCTFDTDDSAELYINGSLETTGSLGANNFGNLSVGRDSTGNTSFLNNGVVDHMEIYNKVLTSGEVSDLFNASNI